MTRRDAIRAGCGAAIAGLAGCGALPSAPARGDDSGGDGPVAVASFFSFFDFGREIADGTPLTVENLVPTGLHGHGWEPNASITQRIIDADAFVHVGADFQPWADRAIDVLEADDVDTASGSMRLPDVQPRSHIRRARPRSHIRRVRSGPTWLRW